MRYINLRFTLLYFTLDMLTDNKGRLKLCSARAKYFSTHQLFCLVLTASGRRLLLLL